MGELHCTNVTLGAWCDNIIVQAVANALNCMIHITQSNNHDSVIISPNCNNENQSITIVFIGHIPEVHYVSTVENHPQDSNVMEYVLEE